MSRRTPAARWFGVKAAPYGRFVFGASGVLFGIIALMWHDADTWQSVRRLWSLPSGTSIGEGLMVAQIAGGLLLQYRQALRVAALVLGIVYLAFSLACIPGIVAHPSLYLEYGSLFEQFSLFCGAVALYAFTNRNRKLRGVVRLAFGACVISFTLSQAFYPNLTAPLVPAWIPPNQLFWALLTTVAFALAAAAIVLNRMTRLATRLLTLMLLSFGVLVWVPLVIAHPQAHGNWSELALTFLIAGAAWVVSDLQ